MKRKFLIAVVAGLSALGLGLGVAGSATAGGATGCCRDAV